MCLRRTLTYKELLKLGRKRGFKNAIQQVALKAPKDITVWKGFNGNTITGLRSPHQGTPLPSNGILKTKKFNGNFQRWNDRVAVFKGIHGALSRKVARDNGPVVKQMVIPKGTLYIESDKYQGHIVALKMVLKSKWCARPKRKNTKPGKRKLVKKRK